MHGKNSEAREKVYFNWIYHLSAISLSLQLYLNTELFHNIKLTKYIQRENKMSDLPIGRIYIKIIITFVAIKAYF
jgi:hypothetical protein